MQHHLLWVWADAGPNAQLDCLSKQPAVIEELQQDDKVLYVHPWYATASLRHPCTGPWDLGSVTMIVMTSRKI